MNVYFIRDSLTGMVKIGWAKDVQKRLRELQTGSAGLLEIVSVVPGGPFEEAGWHRKFASHRHRGEWFKIDATQIPTTTVERTRPRAPEAVPPESIDEYTAGIVKREAKRTASAVMSLLAEHKDRPDSLAVPVLIELRLFESMQKCVEHGQHLHIAFRMLWQSYARAVSHYAEDLMGAGFQEEARAIEAFSLHIKESVAKGDEQATKCAAHPHGSTVVEVPDSGTWVVESRRLTVRRPFKRPDIQTPEIEDPFKRNAASGIGL